MAAALSFAGSAIIGVIIGMALDRSRGSGHAWTLGLGLAGVAVGFTSLLRVLR